MDELFEQMHGEILENMEKAQTMRLKLDEDELKRLSQTPDTRV